jgi:hypothetical protein
MGKPSRQQPLVVERGDGTLYASHRIPKTLWTPTGPVELTGGGGPTVRALEQYRKDRSRAARRAARRSGSPLHPNNPQPHKEQ